MATATQPVITADEIIAVLRHHHALCREILTVVESEHRALGGAETAVARKILLPRLTESLAQLKAARTAWLALSADERRQQPASAALMRQNQDLIMRILLLDRDNEQALLRQGLLSANHLPSAQRQRPHFVADLYRRHAVQ